MSHKPPFVSGLWNAICDECGRQFKSSELRLRWDNLMVCKEDWEPRQPQDYVHGVADIQAPPWTRPEPAEVFVPIYYTEYPAEQIGIDESLNAQAGKVFADIGTLSESTRVYRSLFPSDAITLSSTFTFAASKVLADQFSFLENVQLVPAFNPQDTTTLSEGYFKDIFLVLPRVTGAVIVGNIVNSSVLNGSTSVPSLQGEVISLSENLILEYNGSVFFNETISLIEATTRVAIQSHPLNVGLLNTYTLG